MLFCFNNPKNVRRRKEFFLLTVGLGQFVSKEKISVGQGYLCRPDVNTLFPSVTSLPDINTINFMRSGAHEVDGSYHGLSCTDEHINQPCLHSR
jgi:hypothetical protein